MTRVQFLDSLRSRLDDLPTGECEQIVRSFSDYLDRQISAGTPESDAVAKLGSPAGCAAKARNGYIPGEAARSTRSGNPFEPKMATKKRKSKLMATIREARRKRNDPRYQPDPNGKKPWGLAFALTIVALLCLGAALISHFTSNGTLGYTEQTASFDASQIDRITISEHNRNIVFKPLTSADVRVQYHIASFLRYEVSLSEGVLTIDSYDDGHWYDKLLMLYNSTDPTLVVYLPPDYGGDLVVQSENGSLELSGLTDVADVKLTADSGVITVSDLTVQRNLIAENNNGAITLHNIQAGGNVSLRSVNTPLTADVVSCHSLSMETTNGLITASQVSEAVQSLTLKTTNASIDGSICGAETDFTITAETSNSHSGLQNRSGGSRILEASTTYGVIDIAFIPS